LKKIGKSGKMDVISLFELVKNLLGDLRLLLEEVK
jgi:hypothetical protein